MILRNIMRLGVLACVAALVLVTSSCVAVTADGPVGTAPLYLDKEVWAGHWKTGKGDVVAIEVKRPRAGVLDIQLASQESAVPSAKFTCYLMQCGKWVIGSVEDPKRPDSFYWARVAQSEDQIVVWLPKASPLAALISGNALPGSLDENGDPRLGLLFERHAKILEANGSDVLAWEVPFVMVRLSE